MLQQFDFCPLLWDQVSIMNHAFPGVMINSSMLGKASLMPGASSPLGRSLQQLAESVSSYLDVDGKKVCGLQGWMDYP